MDASAGSAPLSRTPGSGTSDGSPARTGIVGLPATELAARVRSGELSAVDVVRAHLTHLADVDARIGAFRVVRTEAALAEAAAIDASPRRAELPLAGVPVAVKDNVAVAGVPMRHGSAATAATPAAEDDELVARLRAAGCIVVGTTRMPELAAWGFTASTAG